MTTIPTISQLYTQTIADLQSQYGATISPIGQVFLRAVAGVWAAKLRLQYLNLARLQKNIWIDTADPESLGGTLERYGRTFLNRNPFQAQAGEYKLQVTGSIGATIPASTTFKSDDSSLSPGFLFILDSAYTLLSTTDTIIVRALTAGIESKLNVNDTLTATSPIALVNSIVKVVLEQVSPLAAEDIEDYRQKALNRVRYEAQGGSATDYRLWSADAQGVRVVYPYARSGYPSEINLYIEANVADSTDMHGTPTPTIIADVEAVVDNNPDLTLAYRARRPLQVIVNYLPVTPMAVAIEVSGYTAITPVLELSIFDAIDNTVKKIRPYVDAADLVVDKNDILDNNKIINSILNKVPGAVFTTIQIYVNGVPVPTYTFVNGNIPYLDTVSYV